MDERKYLPRRIVVFLISVAMMALGVVISTEAVLGTSPISSVPFVLSLGTDMSLGVATMVFNAFIIVAGILIMRSKYRAVYLLQIVMILVFSILCDVFKAYLGFLQTDNYLIQWALIVLAAFIVAFGVSLEVAANLTMMPGEYFVSFMVYRYHIEFGRMKVIFDVSMIIIAVIMSLLFFGTLNGVREGTVFAAFAVGMIVRRINKVYRKSGFYDWIGYTGLAGKEE